MCKELGIQRATGTKEDNKCKNAGEEESLSLFSLTGTLSICIFFFPLSLSKRFEISSLPLSFFLF